MRIRRSGGWDIVVTRWWTIALALAWLTPAGLSARAPKAPAEEDFLVRYRTKADEFLAKKAVHGPVAEHRCAVCHASLDDPKKLGSESKALCVSCHADVGKEIAKKNVHAVLESGDCTGCHDPHSSDYPFQLSDEIAPVCSTCHQPGDDAIRKAHGGIVVRRSACTGCHSPHGSDGAKLIRDGAQHPPFEQKSCDTCHAKPDKEGGMKLEGDGTRICLTCHPGLEEELSKKVPHRPAKEGTCWACHNPHLAWRTDRAFLKDRPQRLCRTCHPGVFDRNHPVSRHPSWKAGVPDPRDPLKPFDCVSCHLPHGSDHAHLERWTPAEFCFQCHQQ